MEVTDRTTTEEEREEPEKKKEHPNEYIPPEGK